MNDQSSPFRRRFFGSGVASALAVIAFLFPRPSNGQVFDWAIDSFVQEAWGNAAHWNPDTAYPDGVDVTAHIYRSFAMTGTNGISLSARPTVGTLKLGNTYFNSFGHRLVFGGNASARIDFAVSSGTALIDKSTYNEVIFRKRTNFVSDTVVSVTGGVLSWALDGSNVGSIGGNGNLTFEGSGGLAIFDASAITGFATDYGGEITVRGGGTLLINNTLNAYSGGARTVTVENSGTLGGAGTVERQTVVESGATLAPGASPGVLTFTQGLRLETGSAFEFLLTSDTTSGRGTSFNGVNLGGGLLEVEGGVTFNLTFNESSTVDFSNAFWQSDQSWLVVDSANTHSLQPGIFSLGGISTDSLGQSFDITGGSFSFFQEDDNLYLAYHAIPEPSVAWFLAAGALFLLVGRPLQRKGLRRATRLALAGWFAVAGLLSEARADDKGAEGLTLVKEGKAQAEIIVAKDALPQVQFAAKELQDHLQQISGATLAIVHQPTDEGLTPIHVGESEATRALGISLEALPLEGFRIVANDQYLALLGRDKSFRRSYEGYLSQDDLPRVTREWQAFAGARWGLPRKGLYDPRDYSEELGFSVYDPTGTLFAVYDFLEQLGVRWYKPYEFGTVIPDLPTVVVAPQDRSTQPVFSYRYMRWWGGAFPSSDRESFLWFKRQKLGMSDRIWMDHGTREVTQLTGETHPEYRAVINGVVDERAPRLAPPLRDEMVRFADKFFQYHPEVSIFSAAPSDGFVQLDDRDAAAGWDREERGRTGRFSDYVWRFVNEVAKGVYEKHPDKYVMGLAYSAARALPEEIETFAPNVSVTYCQSRGQERVSPEGKAALEKERAGWIRKLPSGQFYIWEYYLHHQEKYGLPGVPVVFTQIMQEDARALRGISRGEFVECSYSGSGNRILNAALNHYPYQVQARLYWNPDLDLDEYLSEYCTRFYGPAADEMKSFFRFAEEVWMRDAPRKLGGDGFLQAKDADQFANLLVRAAKKAGDSVYGKRIALVTEECEPMFESFRSETLQTQGEEALRQGNATAARECFRKSADSAQDANRKLDALLALAKVQDERLQDQESAIQTWLEIWEIHPKSLINTKRSNRLDALLKASRAARKLGKPDLASTIAAKREPRSNSGYWNFAFLQEQAAVAEARGNSREAVEKLEEALLEKNVADGMREKARKEIQRLSAASGNTAADE